MDATTNLDENSAKKDRVLSGFYTVLVNGCIVVLLYFFSISYKAPDPPIQELVLEVALGEPDAGMSDTRSDDPAPQATPPPTESTPDQAIITDESNDATDIQTPPEKKTDKPTQDLPAINMPTKPATRVFGAGRTGTNNDGGGRGFNNRPGNQGDPLGSPDGDPRGVVGGSLDGVTFEGKPRKSVKKYKGTTECDEEGEVVVEFYIDGNGNVQNPKAILAGSSITDSKCKREAEESVKKWAFEPAETARQKARMVVKFRKQ